MAYFSIASASGRTELSKAAQLSKNAVPISQV